MSKLDDLESLDPGVVSANPERRHLWNMIPEIIQPESAGENEERQEVLKTRIYLIDVSPDSGGGSGASTLQRVIEKEDRTNTIIYCFAGTQPPKISLALLNQYSLWLQDKRLHIIEPPGKHGNHPSLQPDSGGSTTHTLAFTAGKLVHEFQPETTKIFVASEDFDLFNVVLCLRNAGFEVESSWPDPESVKCDDDILYTVISQIQRLKTEPPRTLDNFRAFLRNQCNLPPYISLESVMRSMQEKGIISFHKGITHYDPPVMLEQLQETKSVVKRDLRKSETRRR